MIRTSAILSMLILTASTGCGVAAPSSGEPLHLKLLRDDVREARATFDGEPILDVKATSRCTAIIVTSHENTAVNWKDQGNLAAHTQGGERRFDIPAGGKTHILATTEDRNAIYINIQLNALDQECGGI